MKRTNFLATLGALILAPFAVGEVLGREPEPLSATDCSNRFDGRSFPKGHVWTIDPPLKGFGKPWKPNIHPDIRIQSAVDELGLSTVERWDNKQNKWIILGVYGEGS